MHICIFHDLARRSAITGIVKSAIAALAAVCVAFSVVSPAYGFNGSDDPGNRFTSTEPALEESSAVARATKLSDASKVSDSPFSVLRSAPRYITGYTSHCNARLKERNISKAHAESVVENNWRTAYKHRKHGTWQYQDSTIAVSLNNDGVCTTVRRL